MVSSAEVVIQEPLPAYGCGTNVVVLEGTQAASPQKASFPDLLSYEPDASKAAANDTIDGEFEKVIVTQATLVDDFLKGMLQEPDELQGLAEGLKSGDVVLLSGRNENVEQDGVTHAIAELRTPQVMQSKVSNATDSNPLGEVKISLPSRVVEILGLCL